MTFITFEGIDGAGKSTLLEGVARALRARGRPVTTLREPGSTGVGERVRAILLDPGVGTIDPMTEALLFSACRSELVKTVIRPALAKGDVVLLDRYVDSTSAYQGAGGGADPAALDAVAAAATGGLIPDLTVVVDVPVDVSESRRGRAPDRMEARDRAYKERVRASFLALCARPTRSTLLIDGTVDAAVSVAAIVRAMDALAGRG